MINIYEKKETRDTKQERLAALDEATRRVIPDDMLQYVIGDFMDDTEEFVVERMETFKMQPRNTFEERHQCCLHYCGNHRGECMFQCCAACNQFALAPCVVTGIVGAFVGMGCICAFDCVTNNRWRVYDQCCNGAEVYYVALGLCENRLSLEAISLC